MVERSKDTTALHWELCFESVNKHTALSKLINLGAANDLQTDKERERTECDELLEAGYLLFSRTCTMATYHFSIGCQHGIAKFSVEVYKTICLSTTVRLDSTAQKERRLTASRLPPRTPPSVFVFNQPSNVAKAMPVERETTEQAQSRCNHPESSAHINTQGRLQLQDLDESVLWWTASWHLLICRNQHLLTSHL